MQVDVTKASPPTSMMKMMNHHFHQGEEVGEGKRDDEEHNSEEETLPLDSFFLPLNQNSLDKRVKLAV